MFNVILWPLIHFIILNVLQGLTNLIFACFDFRACKMFCVHIRVGVHKTMTLFVSFTIY